MFVFFFLISHPFSLLFITFIFFFIYHCLKRFYKVLISLFMFQFFSRVHCTFHFFCSCFGSFRKFIVPFIGAFGRMTLCCCDDVSVRQGSAPWALRTPLMTSGSWPWCTGWHTTSRMSSPPPEVAAVPRARDELSNTVFYKIGMFYMCSNIVFFADML